MPKHLASCQCGQIAISASNDPEFVIACNCKACQKRTGAPLGTGAYFLRSDLDFTGETNTFGRVSESGRALVNHFCPTCGTSLWWTLEMRPDHIGVALGCFDTQAPTPIRAIWTEEQHGWIEFPQDMPRFPKAT